jgi:hypothetical protein
MDVNKIPTDIVEKVNRKYGHKNLRKFLNYYHSGLPEKYWNSAECKYLADMEAMANTSNVTVLSESVNKSDDIVYNFLKSQIDKKVNCISVDFVTLNSTIIDKFSQINLDVLKEFEKFEIVGIVGLKRYGKIYDRFYPAITSILNTLIHNSSFQKRILLSIETKDDDLEKIGDMFGEEFMNMIISDFEIFSIIK